MNLPIDMRRVYLIARRDFLGYIKTWGFWISFFLPFVFGALGFFASQFEWNVEPVRYETVLDETGQHGAGIIALQQARVDQNVLKVIEATGKLMLSEADTEVLKQIYKDGGMDKAREYLNQKYPGVGDRLKIPQENLVFVDPPADSFEGLRPYLSGQNKTAHNGQPVDLNGVLHIYDKDGQVTANYWSPNINNQTVQNLASRYFRDRASRNYLATGNLTPEGLADARKDRIDIGAFDPSKKSTGGNEGQAVTVTDKIPFYVATILAGILWLTVFSGSYMLLTSMLEEKLNKLMEMMLASTRFSEIIFGKLIGVAALTIAAMLPYILIGAAAVIGLIFFGPPEVAAGLAQAFTLKLVIFFIVFLILGYIFYGAFFIALGALAESMQDAQTLTTPIMLILTACVMVVPLGLNSPDSPLLTLASWFPLSAPFAAIVRLPSDPPWWELALSAGFLFILSIGVIWVAGRVFRYGVLSGAGVKGVKTWIGRVIFRRKA